jgi:hypothetical protein
MYKTGLWKRPTQCVACGQTKGVIDSHVEDYGREPDGTYDEHKRLGLCFRCHMLVHLRLRYPHAWAHYREKIATGFRAPPLFKREFNTVILEHTKDLEPHWIQVEAPNRLILDEIHGGELCPPGRVPGNAPSP